MQDPDYDLVILGGSSTARYAALRAVRHYARVALIEPEPPKPLSFFVQTLTQVGQIAQTLRRSDQWGLSTSSPALNWSALQARMAIAHPILDEAQSLDLLAAAGVDVVVSPGAFVRRPQLGVAVEDRVLRSRAYLLAPASQPTLPSTLPALSEIHGLTVDHLHDQSWKTPPARLVILGHDPMSLELAQSFNRLGSQVTLLVPAAQLLPSLEPESSRLLQAVLEAEGVTVIPSAPIHQIRQRLEAPGKPIEIRLGDQPLIADELLLSMGRQINLTNWNLEAIALPWQPQGVPVNPYLQTSHPRVFACGEALGGYFLPHLARYEADLAVRNALFRVTRKTDYHSVPWVIFTQPQVTQVGFTSLQAQKYYGSAMMRLSVPFKGLERAIATDETTGFCQILVQPNGKILGAHAVGANASEWIGAIALAIQSKLNIKALARLPMVSPSFAEGVSAIATQWEDQRRAPQRDWIEAWLGWGRSWSR
ncbi:MAG: NAD(P)/FAD-dependent oxidoreductase [Oculatellaceae cyanobacterium Prado106]|jgi:pyruvate/2-oxoglutarate dehydrogenase complex dihydrolipoamide dehydrogenase (E3) component|nr:NAD(P)/FAD-dependent oxidoreductase [Oculatellaceae cyanobacterium Prado106]